MTVNKAQGQTFDRLGIFLPDPVFSHGQLYVAFSRTRSYENVYVKIHQTLSQGLFGTKHLTQNVVYKEVL
jgi:ATP-dependent exoDNAse (exonuclease V) alpha subunit